jgi:hypothetical protein
MEPEMRLLLERALAVFESHVEVERRRLEAAAEANRLHERSVVVQEQNGQAYRQRMANFRQQQRWALVLLAVMFIAIIVVLLLTSVRH